MKEQQKVKNIYLIGFMGAGKSTVARELGRQTGAKCVEMDERIETQQGMPITEIFEKYGEEYFRNLETELLREIGCNEDQIISCGGGKPGGGAFCSCGSFSSGSHSLKLLGFWI